MHFRRRSERNQRFTQRTASQLHSVGTLNPSVTNDAHERSDSPQVPTFAAHRYTPRRLVTLRIKRCAQKPRVFLKLSDHLGEEINSVRVAQLLSDCARVANAHEIALDAL